MAVEATFSKFKVQNDWFYIGVCLVASFFMIKDGYIDQDFIAKHTLENGKPDETLLFFNQIPPFIMIPLAIWFAVLFFINKGKKIVAGDTEVTDGKVSVAYSSIEAIDKSQFDKKGIVTIIYEDGQGQEQQLKLSDRTYDHLPAVVDHIAAKIS